MRLPSLLPRRNLIATGLALLFIALSLSMSTRPFMRPLYAKGIADAPATTTTTPDPDAEKKKEEERKAEAAKRTQQDQEEQRRVQQAKQEQERKDEERRKEQEARDARIREEQEREAQRKREEAQRIEQQQEQERIQREQKSRDEQEQRDRQAREAKEQDDRLAQQEQDRRDQQNRDAQQPAAADTDSSQSDTRGNAGTDHVDGTDRVTDDAPRPDMKVPDADAQIANRTEAPAPTAAYRAHFGDRFYYPYDLYSYAHYPFNGHDYVISFPMSGHKTPARLRKGSANEALYDISFAWLNRSAGYLMRHTTRQSRITVYFNGRYSHTLTQREFYELTLAAFKDTITTGLNFASVKSAPTSVIAKARHEFYTSSKGRRWVSLTYYLRKINGMWLIQRMDINPGYRR